MRKNLRLNTWERATLKLATGGITFSSGKLYKLLKKVYSEVTATDVSRTVKTLAKLGYLNTIEEDPFFNNRTSYTSSKEGKEFYLSYLNCELKLQNLINENKSKIEKIQNIH